MHNASQIANITLSLSANSTLFPPNYTLGQVIFISTLMTFLSLLTILGNTLVILSFYLDKTIRTPSNYFILSLGISDLIIGFEGFPIFTVYVIQKSWTMGWFMCDLWLSVDYVVCLASIYTVLMITIDRYCSVRIATVYRSWRTQQRVEITLAVVWIVPTVLFFVTIFGWSSFTGERAIHDNVCMVQFMKDKYFNMSMYIAYYWSTLAVMILLYIGIYRAAWSLQQKSQKRQERLVKAKTLRDSARVPLPEDRLCITPTKQDGGSTPMHHRSSSQKTDSRSFETSENSSYAIAEEQKRQAAEKRQQKHQAIFQQVAECSSGSRRLSFTQLATIMYYKNVWKALPKQKMSATARLSIPINSALENQIGDLQDPRSPIWRRRIDDHSTTLLSTLPDNSTDSDSGDKKPNFESIESRIIRKHSSIATTGGESKMNITEDDPSTAFDPFVLYSPATLRGFRFIDQDSAASSLRSNQLTNATSLPILTPQNSTKEDKLNSSRTLPTIEVDTIVTRPTQNGIRRGYLNCDYFVREGESLQTTAPEISSTVVPSSTRESQQLLVEHQNTPKQKSMRKTSKREVSLRRRTSQVLSLLRYQSRKDRAGTIRSENRARKALRTITFILGAFIFFWTPFYVVATVYGFCPLCIPAWLYEASYYMCYMNSPINPLCYALANAQFRKAFIRILKGNFRRMN